MVYERVRESVRILYWTLEFVIEIAKFISNFGIEED